jgi:hypothetical protein
VRTKQIAHDPLIEWRNIPIFDEDDDDPFGSISPPTRDRVGRDLDGERGEKQSGDAPQASKEKERETDVGEQSRGDETV